MRMRIVQLIGEIILATEEWALGHNDLWIENDQACTNYGGCKYLNHCRRAPSVRESIREHDFVKIERDPEAFKKFETCKEGELIV